MGDSFRLIIVGTIVESDLSEANVRISIHPFVWPVKIIPRDDEVAIDVR